DCTDFPRPERYLPDERFRQRLPDELVHGIGRRTLLAEIVQRHMKEPAQCLYPLKPPGTAEALPQHREIGDRHPPGLAGLGQRIRTFLWREPRCKEMIQQRSKLARLLMVMIGPRM